MSTDNTDSNEESQESFQKTPYEKLDEIAEHFSGEEGEEVCIFTQPSPDPDAIGSAMGLKWLFEAEHGIMCDIFHSGKLSHPQNRTMANVLDVDLKHRKDFDPDAYSLFCVVDTVPQNTGFQDIVDHFHVVIDHHQFDIKSDLVDIRSVGACSSMVYDYLHRHDGLDFDTERGGKVATGIVFGLRNDTDILLSDNVSELDYKTHRELTPLIDQSLMKEIVNYSQPSHMLDLKKKAIENRVTKDSVMISGLGIISGKKRDALPIIADEFLHTEGVQTVIVFSIVDDSVEASVRSNNSSVSAHDLCQSIFGEDYSGGKNQAGGAEVPIGFLYSSEDDKELRDEIWDTARKILTKRILGFVSRGGV
jgi:nanoRNase/pAp phosphatase (c-di-AMP/oligoRNAs hydrolase)